MIAITTSNPTNVKALPWNCFRSAAHVSLTFPPSTGLANSQNPRRLGIRFARGKSGSNHRARGKIIGAKSKFRAVHSSRRKFLIRVELKKAATIAAKSADRNSFQLRRRCAPPERLLRCTLEPADNTILRMVMEIRNEPLNHRPFALRTVAWCAHIRSPYRMPRNNANLRLAQRFQPNAARSNHRIYHLNPFLRRIHLSFDLAAHRFHRLIDLPKIYSAAPWAR